MESQTSNIRQLPLELKSNKEMIQEALDKGANRAKIIWTKNIAIATWNKLQCQFGCSHYGKLHTCPPHSPVSDETAEILVDSAACGGESRYERNRRFPGSELQDQRILQGVWLVFPSLRPVRNLHHRQFL
jgi:hypothetical protein